MRKIARVTSGVIAILVLWEILGQLVPSVYNVISTPAGIVQQFWQDLYLYKPHVISTVRSAFLGFIFGNGVAILAALIFCQVPLLGTVFAGVNVALFAMPPIVIGPILVLIFHGDKPQIILSALILYFPTMAATLVGLRDIDPRLVDVVHIYGGRKGTLMRLVRLRSSLPSLLAGLRISASLAVLGAVLGEFGSGTRWGLGTFLLGSLGQANPARLWGIGLTVTAIAMFGYALVALIGRQIAGSTIPVTIAANKLPDQISGSKYFHSAQRALALIMAAVLPFLLWGLVLRVTKLNPVIAPGPLETLGYLFVSPDAEAERAIMLHALVQTLPVAGLGMLAGLAAAFILAALTTLKPKLASTIFPLAMVMQCTPLVAMVPFLLIVFGRGTTASVFMAILVVFFPAFVMLSQGFQLVPRTADELVQAYGGSRLKGLVMVSVPYATPYLFTAAKLVVPRALLGVMLAEWLLTGVGLGGLLEVSRGNLDYGMVWTGALISILISIAAYQGIDAMERLFQW